MRVELTPEEISSYCGSHTASLPHHIVPSCSKRVTIKKLEPSSRYNRQDAAPCCSLSSVGNRMRLDTQQILLKTFLIQWLFNAHRFVFTLLFFLF